MVTIHVASTSYRRLLRNTCSASFVSSTMISLVLSSEKSSPWFPARWKSATIVNTVRVISFVRNYRWFRSSISPIYLHPLLAALSPQTTRWNLHTFLRAASILKSRELSLAAERKNHPTMFIEFYGDINRETLSALVLEEFKRWNF